MINKNKSLKFTYFYLFYFILFYLFTGQNQKLDELTYFTLSSSHFFFFPSNSEVWCFGVSYQENNKKKREEVKGDGLHHQPTHTHTLRDECYYIKRDKKLRRTVESTQFFGRHSAATTCNTRSCFQPVVKFAHPFSFWSGPKLISIRACVSNSKASQLILKWQR